MLCLPLPETALLYADISLAMADFDMQILLTFICQDKRISLTWGFPG